MWEERKMVFFFSHLSLHEKTNGQGHSSLSSAEDRRPGVRLHLNGRHFLLPRLKKSAQNFLQGGSQKKFPYFLISNHGGNRREKVLKKFPSLLRR
jgi:hypothetical protein